MQKPNNAASSQNHSMGYPANIEPHLSHKEADHIMHSEASREINLFIDALEMQNPVPYDAAVTFLEATVKDGLPPDAIGLADSMRQHDWEQYLSPSEDLQAIAKRADTFLRTEDGILLVNFFIRTTAKTKDSMF